MMHSVTPVDYERDSELDRARRELERSTHHTRGAFAELRELLKRMSDEINPEEPKPPVPARHPQTLLGRHA